LLRSSLLWSLTYVA